MWSDGSAADVRHLLSTIARNAETGSWRAIHENCYDRLLSTEDKNHLVSLHSADDGTELILEVGWGTIEIATNVCDDLFEMKRKHERALRLVVDTAESIGMRVLGFGIQPRTEPTLQLLSPKARYGVMKDVIGHEWLSFTATASDQLHVDVERGEMTDVLNVSNAMSAVVIALCGNSSVYAGQKSSFVSSREGLMSAMSRHGMPERYFRSVDDYVDAICDLRYLMRPVKGGWRAIEGDVTFREHVAEFGADWTSFLAHDHYVWYSARARTKQRTVELRSACQQPFSDHMSAAALQLGIVEGASSILRYMNETFGCEHDGDAMHAMWENMLRMRRYAIRNGLSLKASKASTSFATMFGTNDKDGRYLMNDESSDAKQRLVSREEWRQGGFDDASFDLVDQNRDGYIDEHEWDNAALPRHLCEAAASNNVSRMQRLLIGLPHDEVVAASLAAARNDMTSLKDVLGVQTADFSAFPVPYDTYVRDVLNICNDALIRRGLGEEIFLSPLYERLDHGENPGQVARRLAGSEGMSALVEHCAIRPGLFDEESQAVL